MFAKFTLIGRPSSTVPSNAICGECGSMVYQHPDSAPFRAVTPQAFKIEDGTVRGGGRDSECFFKAFSRNTTFRRGVLKGDAPKS